LELTKKRSRNIFILIFILFFFFLTYTFSGDRFLLKDDSVTSLNEGWRILDGEESAENTTVSLPHSADTPAGEAMVLQQPLNEDFSREQTLLIRSSLQDLRVSVEGEIIFEQQFNYEKRFQPPVASVWNLVTIPEGSEGKSLTIELTSPFDRMSGQANPILYGPPGSLMMQIIYTYGPGFFLAVLTLLTGLFLILVHYFFRKIQYWDLSYIGYFAVFISLWLISESRMLQFFTGNQFLIGSLAYIMLSVFPIPLILYIKRSVTSRYTRVLNGMIILYVINILLIITLQITGVRAFFQTVAISHGLMVISIIISSNILFQEIHRHKNKDAVVFVRSLGIIFFFGFIELFHFYFFDAQATSQFIRVGLLLFILLQSFDSITRLLGYIKKSYKAEAFEKMAYLDQLTNAPNRMAYNRDLREFFKYPEKLESFYLGMFDLNNLKQINDTQGHVKGDEAIILAYQILRDTFKDYGTCYRIGGDEFSCILPELPKDTLERLKEQLEKEINFHSDKQTYALSIAAGYSYYKPAIDKNLEDLIHRADQRMYQDKREKKNIASI